MKSRMLFLAAAFFSILPAGIHAGGCSTPTAVNCWWPASGAGYHVQFVTWTMRTTVNYPAGTNAQISVAFQEQVISPTNYAVYYYNFDKNDQASLKRAETIYATLLTAKSSGEFASIWLDNTGNIADVQLGANP